MGDLWPSPHPCVVLGIDPAASSGWAVHTPDASVREHGVRPSRIHTSSWARDRAERMEAIETARLAAGHRELPLIVVAEDWQSGHMPALAYGGLREQWGRWADAIEGHLGDVPIVRVLCQTWRAGLGLRPFIDASVLARPKKERDRAAWKRAAVVAVKARFGLDVNDDEAEGICVATWGAHSQQVADVLAPKKRRRRAS